MEALVVAGFLEMRAVGLRVVLVFALEHLGEVAVSDLALAHRGDDGARDLVVGMALARAAVVDAGRRAIFPEPEVDVHDVFDVDEVAALLAVGDGLAVNGAPAAEEVCLARLVDLVVELVEDGRHLSLVVLLRAVDVEIAQTDDLAARLGHDLAHIAVDSELAEGVRVQRVLAGIEDALLVEVLRLHETGIAPRLLGIDPQQWRMINGHGQHSFGEIRMFHVKHRREV